MNKELNEIFRGIVEVEDNDTNKENANMSSETPAGQMLKFASETSKRYALENLVSSEFANLHKQGYIHIHDLDYYPTKTTTCVQYDLKELFENGFHTKYGYIRPAKRIDSRATLATIIFQSNQAEQHGGQAIPAFDFAMADGVLKTFKDKFIEQLTSLKKEETENVSYIVNNEIYSIELTEKDIFKLRELLDISISDIRNALDIALKITRKETHQSMEGFIHNLNTMHCQPHDSKIWVYNEKDELRLLTIQEIVENFEPKKYRVISINPKTGIIGLNYIYSGEKKDNNRNLIKIKGKSGQTITTTDNHNTLFFSEEGIDWNVPSLIHNFLTPVNFDILPQNNVFNLDNYSSRKSQNYKFNKIEITEEFSEFLGWYIADGSITGGSQICLTFCDEELRDRSIEIMKKVYGESITYKTYNYINNKGEEKFKEIRFNVGKVWADLFKDKFGKNSKTKTIPSELLGSSLEIKKKLIEGYFYCDGKIGSYIIATTVSKDLRDKIGLLFLSMGEVPYYATRVISSGSISYEISLGAKQVKRLGLNFKMPETKFEQFKQSREIKEKFKNNCISEFNLDHFSVIDIKEKQEGNSENDYVYDISVENDENYLTEEGIFTHNSRAGNQVVFSSINYGTDSSPEGRMVIEEVMNATVEGLGDGETPIFPIQIFKVKEGLNFCLEDYNLALNNWTKAVRGELKYKTPNFDLLIKACITSSKRLFPNFLFLDTSYNKHDLWNINDPDRYKYEVATMGFQCPLCG